METKRDTSRDGIRFRIEFFLMTHFHWFWALLQRNRFLNRILHRILVRMLLDKMPHRPNPYSTLSPYTSWDSLTDHSYKARYLAPVSEESIKSLPPVEEVAKLFLRKPGKEILSDKASILLPYFAVWFFEPIVNSDPKNPLKNFSTQEIDLIALYGKEKKTTDMLRSKVKGKLKSQMINGEEYPPYYYENGVVKEEFKDLPIILFDNYELPAEKKNKLFALGLPKGNRQLGTMMLSTVFLREHNRICDLLSKQYPAWDDERLFQTARNIVIILFLKVVVEDYINVISPYSPQLTADPLAFPNEPWFRPNWFSVEYDLLYRWHSLMPEKLVINGKSIPMMECLGNTDLLVNQGLGQAFENASVQPSGKIGVHNTPAFLMPVERSSIELGRIARLASFNDHRELASLPRYTEFNQITANKEVQEELKNLYGTVDRIEFYPGIFAEDPRKNDVAPNLMRVFLGIDAISQAFTNPMFAPRVFNKETFSPIGMEIIENTSNISDIVNRNTKKGDRKYRVSMALHYQS